MGHYITNGGLCKVTITDVPPEVEGAITPSSEHSRSMASHSPLPAEIAEHFPAIRQTESLFDRKGHQQIRKTNSGRNKLRLPPSPNGMLVHNGPDINKSLLLNTLPKHANEFASNNKHPDADTTKDTKKISKKSSKVAKEIFDKYNMKSEAHNMLPGKHIYNGFQQLSMPWRNKTFLTLPIRFNGNIRMKNAKYLDSDQLSISSRNIDFNSNVSVVCSEFDDWAGGE